MKTLLRYVFFISLLGLTFLNGWTQNKYWIKFTDKGKISTYLDTDILSERALAQRRRKGIALDYSDYPVHPEYLKALSMRGIRIENRSRWFNSVTAYLSYEEVLTLQQLPFVESLRPVRLGHRITAVEETLYQKGSHRDYDTFMDQLRMVELDKLQEMGYTGRGIMIAVFDGGFRGVDQLTAFQHLFEEDRILATWDYVDSDSEVYEPCCSHGMQVLSVLAGQIPGQLQGSAPDAEYILLRTEQVDAEIPQEEDNWVAAAELADSLGAQVFSTSLGYADFDNPQFNYTRAELDGNTTVITRASDLAAAKGIVVVTSAGNRAELGVTAPADGDSVISVGAVDEFKEWAPFSSYGFTIDNRVKPDVMAMGSGTKLLYSNGEVNLGFGTSFACPIISGMLACLMQAHPGVNNGDLYQALIRSSDRFDRPDQQYGYGIPSAMAMHESLGISTVSTPDLLENRHWVISPNPGSNTFSLSANYNPAFSEILLEVINLQGKRLATHTFSKLNSRKKSHFQLNLAPGMYMYFLKNTSRDVYVASGKLFITH